MSPSPTPRLVLRWNQPTRPGAHVSAFTAASVDEVLSRGARALRALAVRPEHEVALQALRFEPRTPWGIAFASLWRGPAAALDLSRAGEWFALACAWLSDHGG